MNMDCAARVIAIAVEPNNGFLCFNKEFVDKSVWSAAFEHNISTKVFDYNEYYKIYQDRFPKDHKNVINEDMIVTDVCEDIPLIKCKDFTMIKIGDKINRMDKFVGKIYCKYDVDYDMIHVWFSTLDNEEHYMYLGCVSKDYLDKECGINVVFKLD